MIQAEEDWDKILHTDPTYGRENRLSASIPTFRGCVLDNNEIEFARLERARRAESTSCGGLFNGQMFDKIAGRTDAECKGARNGGPPNGDISYNLLNYQEQKW
jgi:hypothetical protein